MKAILALVAAWAGFIPAYATATLPVHYGLFGDIHLAVPASMVRRTIILISDRNGWDARAESLSQALSDDGALVFGVDLPEYLKHMLDLKDKCAYPAGHFEGMSDWMQHHQGMDTFMYPLIAGDGAGANFAYAVTAQAPAGTFASLLTLGFDNRFRLSKPMCPGDAGAMTASTAEADYRIIPVRQLPCEWMPLPFADTARVDGVLGQINRLVKSFSWLWRSEPAQAPGVVLAEHVARWQRRSNEASQLPTDVADLPLVEQAHRDEFAHRIAIILTGDGGWAGLDIAIANQLSKRGIDVVGLNTLKFFWHTRKPEEAADALTRIVGHYGALHPEADFIVIGYSFGAALAPVVVNRAAEQVQKRIAAQVLISPDADAVFEIKVGDWLGGAKHDGALPIEPELATTKVPAICVHGIDEHEASACSKVEKSTVRTIELPGGHHYNGDYDALGAAILKALPIRKNSADAEAAHE